MKLQPGTKIEICDEGTFWKVHKATVVSSSEYLHRLEITATDDVTGGKWTLDGSRGIKVIDY